MTYLVIVLIIAGWLLCSVIAYAGTFAYYQREFMEWIEHSGFNRRHAIEFNKEEEGNEKLFCATMALAGGPISLIISFIFTGFYQYGLRFW